MEADFKFNDSKKEYVIKKLKVGKKLLIKYHILKKFHNYHKNRGKTKLFGVILILVLFFFQVFDTNNHIFTSM